MSRTLATNRVALKENYIVREGESLESFQTLGDWTLGGAAGTVSADTAHFTDGTQSITVTFVSGTSAFFDKTISQKVNGHKGMFLKIYVQSLTDLGSVALYIASVSNFSKFFSKTIQATALHEGYNYIPIAPSEWSNTGSESWANTMVRLRIRVNATTGTPSVSFCSLRTSQYNASKVLVTFDDSWDSQYSKAYAYMSTLGLKGTIYAIGSKLGTAGYCTLANLQEMYADGWDIGNHGSVNLTTLATQAEQEAEVLGEERYIKEFTRSCKHYAYPNGGYDDNAKNALEQIGYLSARTIIDRNQANYLDEKYLLTRYGIYNSTSVATAKSYIDSCIAQGASILLNFHIIVDATADVSTKVLTADFQALMDYILLKKRQGLVDVPTVSEWYNGLSV